MDSENNNDVKTPKEVIDSHKYQNNPLHNNFNPNIKDAGLEKALSRKDQMMPNMPNMVNPNIGSDLEDRNEESGATPPDKDNIETDSDMNIDRAEVQAEEQNSSVAVAGEVRGISRQTRIVLIASISFAALFFLLFIIAVAFLAKNSDNLNYASGSYFENEEYTELYAEVESVVSEYQRKYGVTVDKYLIIAALTAYQDNEMYFNDTESGAYDYTSVDDTDSEGATISKTITEMTAKIEILAKYQIKTTTSCSMDSSTMRKIASNDDSSSWYNFWTSAADREKNYDCSGDSSSKSYSLSIDQGSLDDEESGSTFYWNMIDEDFFVEYYPEYFSGILDDDLYESHADQVLDYIYLYADYLRSLDDCDSSSSSIAASLTASNVTCSGVTVTGNNAGTYDLESYVAGVVASEFSPSYMRAFTTDADAIYEDLKAFTIVIRTYTINRTNGCTTSIRNSSFDQNFSPTDNAEIWAVVNETSGVILTYNGEIFSSEYDSFKGNNNCNSSTCSYEYTKLPNGEKHTVTIPYSGWGSRAAGGHGRGMSQIASLYMASLGSNYLEIIEEFYSDGVTLQTLSGTTSSLTTAYCSRGTSTNGEGTCDGSSYYGSKTIGSDTLSSEMSLLACTADQAEQAFNEIYEACGTIPHAGSMRDLNASVNASRSSTSLHYTGRAFDLDTGEGMQEGDTYFYVTYDDTSGNDNSHYYRLYCKVTGTSTSSLISTKTITTLKWTGSSVTTKSTVTDTFLDVTAVFNKYGLYGIAPRTNSGCSGNYMCTEWWHFQDTSGLVSGTTTFKTALNQYHGLNYDYSGTPVSNYLNRKWNGGSFSG